mmetsp:Transcript_124588/g.360321  ORF Transcript_124588/g.360321 Transcript_124588/m.360321 type:complete len:290 (+) Transcript_124588:321-1190(+)
MKCICLRLTKCAQRRPLRILQPRVRVYVSMKCARRRPMRILDDVLQGAARHVSRRRPSRRRPPEGGRRRRPRRQGPEPRRLRRPQGLLDLVLIPVGPRRCAPSHERRQPLPVSPGVADHGLDVKRRRGGATALIGFFEVSAHTGLQTPVPEEQHAARADPAEKQRTANADRYQSGHWHIALSLDDGCRITVERFHSHADHFQAQPLDAKRVLGQAGVDDVVQLLDGEVPEEVDDIKRPCLHRSDREVEAQHRGGLPAVWSLGEPPHHLHADLRVVLDHSSDLRNRPQHR